MKLERSVFVVKVCNNPTNCMVLSNETCLALVTELHYLALASMSELCCLEISSRTRRSRESWSVIVRVRPMVSRCILSLALCTGIRYPIQRSFHPLETRISWHRCVSERRILHGTIISSPFLTPISNPAPSFSFLYVVARTRHHSVPWSSSAKTSNPSPLFFPACLSL